MVWPLASICNSVAFVKNATVDKRSIGLDKRNSVALYYRPMQSVNAILQRLKTSGYRRTPVRETLVSLFVASPAPLSVPELQLRLKKKKLPVNKTTVYREIEFLQKEAVIVPVYVDSDKVKYELTGAEHHHHVVCQSCDTVEDIDSSALEKIMKRLESKVKKNSKFAQVRHSVEFFGQCRSCART